MEEIESKSAIINALYPAGDDESERLKMVTEIPPDLIMVAAIHATMDAALTPNRTRSLRSIFVEQIDKRMISRDRKGREEFIELVRQQEKDSDSLDFEVM